MRAPAAVPILLALTIGCLAAGIKSGATVQVKPDSIWFDEADQLAKWHELKKSGDAAALTAYQDERLHRRDAWQFVYPLTVKILGYDAKNAQVHVRMLTKGRFEGLDFYIDPGGIMP